MAMKRRPASCGPSTAFTRSKKYCLKILGSSVDPDEEGVLQIDLVLERLHLGRVGRIEHVKLREARDLPEGHLHPFRPEARSPHRQQEDVGEAGAPGHIGNVGQPLDMGQLVVRDAEPAEPLRFILAGPQ